MFSKFLLIFNTVRYLKPIQVYYQLFYRLIGKPVFKKYAENKWDVQSKMKLDFHAHPYKRYESINGNHTFHFLNISKTFPQLDINWNDNTNGKLWTYHLNYFEFLIDCDLEHGKTLIEHYIGKAQTLIDGCEPYPTSLRIINWIKFSIKYNYQPSVFLGFIKADLERLNQRLEYHLLANHLLENYCALWIGACYFKDESLARKASKGLSSQLQIQFNKDGMHFERSPMYHVVLLARLIDCWEALLSLDNKAPLFNELKTQLEGTLKRGLLKLNWFTTSGKIPEFNDSTNEETPCISPLLAKFNNWKINSTVTEVNDSGFYLFENGDFKMYTNYGEIKPSYQPGHAHADLFSFVLYYRNESVVCDNGISTYEKNGKRAYERGTMAHNTISVNGTNSSEVWGGFRVGKRAKVKRLNQTENGISACHDGFSKFGIIHQREIAKLDSGIVIKDKIIGNTSYPIYSSMHFSNDVNLVKKENSLILNDKIEICFNGVSSWRLEEYELALGYNKLTKSVKWIGEISSDCEIIISNLK